MRYKNQSKEKNNGVVYTPPALAASVAEAIVAQFQPEPNQDTIKVLEPALGEGELALALLRILQAKYPKHQILLQAYDIDSQSLATSAARFKAEFPQVAINFSAADFLNLDDYGGEFDLIIANPPYVRTQTLAVGTSQQLAQRFGLHGKVDIYYAFFIAALEALKEGGIAGFITSNKYLTISSGRSLRRYLYEHARLLTISDLGDTKVFANAAVLPCVTVFTKRGLLAGAESYQVQFNSVYLSNATDQPVPINHVCDCVGQAGHFIDLQGSCYQAQTGYVVLGAASAEAPWVLTSKDQEQWLEQVQRNTWKSFGEVAPVRVGIKTCADNVFLFDRACSELEFELTKPLITHRNAGCYRPNLTERWSVLYPHYDQNGRQQAYDLTHYPKSQAYLCKHYDQLNGRAYVHKAGRAWYELWVPQKPALWAHSKIVFRDIAEYPQFWLVTEDAVINGDCYWMDFAPDAATDVMYLMLAVANSRFIVDFYDRKFNTKLYSSKRRFMKQYVERFPIPDPKRPLCQEIISLVQELLATKDNTKDLKARIDDLVAVAFTG